MTHGRKRLYLIDGNSYIYRAFHAIRNLSNSRGFPTNAIYGFATMLLKIVREEKPDYLAVVFDTKGPTTRHEYYPQYKATRPPMPEGMVPQIPVIWDLVRAYRIPVIQQEGIEADDLLAAAAREGLQAPPRRRARQRRQGPAPARRPARRGARHDEGAALDPRGRSRSATGSGRSVSSR